ncbi:MAG: hypothetical protein JSS83_14345 [Cyanobacteria bacterium SZAS LIN-3]|nr:hypothetical protein [Cyanobacteria bacterium SZAS LIN-3]
MAGSYQLAGRGKDLRIVVSGATEKTYYHLTNETEQYNMLARFVQCSDPSSALSFVEQWGFFTSYRKPEDNTVNTVLHAAATLGWLKEVVTTINKRPSDATASWLVKDSTIATGSLVLNLALTPTDGLNYPALDSNSNRGAKLWIPAGPPIYLAEETRLLVDKKEYEATPHADEKALRRMLRNLFQNLLVGAKQSFEITVKRPSDPPAWSACMMVHTPFDAMVQALYRLAAGATGGYLRFCKACGHEIWIGPNERTRSYCNDTCRKAANRKGQFINTRTKRGGR